MNENKLVLHKVSKIVTYPVAKHPRIRVDRDTYIKIAHLATETNQTLNDITTELLNFALKNVVIGDEIIIETQEG